MLHVLCVRFVTRGQDALLDSTDGKSGMPIYSEAVKGAFQLITDAYGQLSQLAAAASK